MQRENVFKKLIKGLGYILFGNILSGIMLISIAPVINIWLLTVVAFLFTMIIFLSLMFTVGYKDGERERVLMKNKRVEAPAKNGWLLYGLIPGIVWCVPVVVVLLGIFEQITITGEYMFTFRFLCGAVEPLVYIGGFQSAAITEYPLWFPIAGMGIYVIGSSAAAMTGFKFGYDDKLSGSFMYEKTERTGKK